MSDERSVYVDNVHRHLGMCLNEITYQRAWLDVIRTTKRMQLSNEGLYTSDLDMIFDGCHCPSYYGFFLLFSML